MSPRKTILRELSRFRERAGRATFTRPAEIAGFADRPSEYQKAVNALLRDRMIDGRRDPDGRMAIALNEHRLDAVRREIRPLWARPLVWLTLCAAALVSVVAALGFGGAGT